MLVDDEKNVYSCNTALTHNGYWVQAFPQEALKCFKESRSRFDLVILDLIMPSLNGVELYTKLKAISKISKYYFICSGRSTRTCKPSPRRKADILRKPIATEDFINAVKKKRQKS